MIVKENGELLGNNSFKENRNSSFNLTAFRGILSFEFLIRNFNLKFNSLTSKIIIVILVL